MKNSLITTILVLYFFSCNATKKQSLEEARPSYNKNELKLSIEKNKIKESDSRFIFIAQNKSTDTISTTDLLTLFNEIEVIYPDGEVVGLAMSTPKLNIVDILPEESKSWSVDQMDSIVFARNRNYDKKSKYRIIWKLYNRNKKVSNINNPKFKIYQCFTSDTINVFPTLVSD